MEGHDRLDSNVPLSQDAATERSDWNAPFLSRVVVSDHDMATPGCSSRRRQENRFLLDTVGPNAIGPPCDQRKRT